MLNNNNNNNNGNHQQRQTASLTTNNTKDNSRDIQANNNNKYYHRNPQPPPLPQQDYSIFGVQHQQPQQHNNLNKFNRFTNLNDITCSPPPNSGTPFVPPLPSSSSSLTNTVPCEMAAEQQNHHYHHHHHHNQTVHTNPNNNKNNQCDPLLASIRTSANSNHHSSFNRSTVVYVYELPYDIRKSICDLLDADNSWRELGGRYMGFNDTQLTLISHALYRSSSPTNELLTKWESSNAKVAHLFMYLAQMKHHRAMYYLLPFVNKKLRMVYETSGGSQILNDKLQSIAGTSKIHNELTMLSIKEPNLKYSTLKESNDDDDRHYKDEHLMRKSNEEKTLIDINNETKPNDKDKRNANQECQEYLLKIDDFKISYKELAIATDDFANDNILGSGGFGTVFLGDWKGTKVAIKKLKGLDNLTQAFTELRILNCCRIDNILPLYAVSLDGPEPCLVYQYMANGSLEDRLLCKNNTQPLTWHQRLKIAEGVARALNFLHTLKGNPFVHGDVKSANILLDTLFEPKLGDFGLARQVVKNSRNENSIYTHCTVTSVNGTSVYLPAEYLRQKILSPAVDVYSYGIVVLEMATGRRAYNGKKLLINSVEDEYSKAVQNASINLQQKKKQQQFSIKTASNENHYHHSPILNNEKSLEQLMDKRIANLTEGRHFFNYLLELGRKCAHKTKSKRPFMVQILEYFNQCRSTERIHRLCDKVIQNKLLTSKMSISKASIKSPVELQLWYDFVRKSCGTLSEVVFENFDAQVTKIIEDLVSKGDSSVNSSESTYCLELLLNTKNRFPQKQQLSAPQQQQQSNAISELVNTESSISSLSSTSNPTCKSFNNTLNDSKNADNDAITNNNFSQFLRLINSNNDNSTDSLAFNNNNENINKIPGLVSDSNPIANQDNVDQYEEQSEPLIPLLTALGFDPSNLDELIDE